MRTSVLNYPIDSLSMDDVLHQVDLFIMSGQPHYIAVTNAAKFWRMERDERLRNIVNSASLILPEKAIVMGGKFLGQNIKEPILGVSLFKKLLSCGNERHYKVYFYGAKKEIVTIMVEKLKQSYRGLNILGFHDGYAGISEMPALLQDIKTKKPDILFIALGTPRQEYWAEEYFPSLDVPVCIGLGGSFDVVAGIKKDCPSWIRAIAMEWLYRTVQDPKNLLKRYAITIPWFLKRILLEKWKMSFTPRIKVMQTK